MLGKRKGVPMIDELGRNITYLRLSVTELCDLRCRYCMAEAGVEKRSHRDLCSFEELRDFAAAAADLGVRKLRITGGEPLARRGIAELCAMLRAVPGIEELCLTTNGTRLAQMAPALRQAGVDRLNISIDSLRPERYRDITRVGELSRVLQGIEHAEAAGFADLKLNCVLMGGVNDDEIGDFVRLTADKPWEVRFIELMPMGVCAAWPKERFLPAGAVLERVPGLEPAGEKGVAKLYRLPGARGTVGLIEPMSCAFCADCTRIRITADGKLKPCLHSREEVPLRGLRGQALREAIRQGVSRKPRRHRMDETGHTQTPRGMFEIGG